MVGKQVKRFGGEVCGKGGVGLFHIMGLTHKGVTGQTCSETDSPINLLKICPRIHTKLKRDQIMTKTYVYLIIVESL